VQVTDPFGIARDNVLWLLKNSLAKIALKKRRARKPYKRFSPNRYTFLVTQFEPDFVETDFFNVLFSTVIRPPRLVPLMDHRSVCRSLNDILQNVAVFGFDAKSFKPTPVPRRMQI
jgi:hypothetical protein